MKISLTKKMALVFGLTSLLIIAMFFSVTYFVINTSFTRYINETQEEQNQEIVSFLGSVYDSDEKYSEEVLTSLWHRAMMAHYYLTLWDEDKNILWQMERESIELMDGIMLGMTDEGSYGERTYPIKQNNEIVGYIAIGQYGSHFLTEADINFQESLYKGLILTSLLGTILAILLGIVNAKELANPILKIKDTADILQKGDLTARAQLKSKTKEVKELADSINHLGFSLEQQEQLRKRLTSDVSHELRTPLNVLKNYLEALMDGIWEPTYKRLKICYDEVDRLTDLVKGLENLTNLESDEIILQKEPRSLEVIIKSVVQQFKPSFYEKEIFIEIDMVEDSQVHIDVNKFKQVFVNLLSNALKFTDSHGTVIVKLFRSNLQAVVQVKDTGIGIDKKDLPFIFERFYRAEQSRSRKTGGAGLGLAIVEQIIETHGGTIQVESEPAKGTVFTLSLPMIDNKIKKNL